MQKSVLMYEEDVFSIVQDYLNENRYFTMEDIIPYIQVRLKKIVNLNQKGIKVVLKSLIKKKLVVERSKFTKEDVLENKNRALIYNYIKDNPGLYFNQIAKNLSLSNYILAWHLKILSQFDFIRTKEIQNHEALYDADLDPQHDEILFLISKEKARGIINYLLEHPEGTSKTQLSKHLHMHSNTVSKYVSKLDNAKVLLKKQLSRKTIYFVNEKYYHSLMGYE